MVDWTMTRKQKKRLTFVWLPIVSIGIILLIVAQVVG